MKKLGILTNDSPLRSEENRAILREHFEVHDFSKWDDFSQAELREKVRSVEVVLTGWGSPQLPDDLAEDFGELRYVAHIKGSVRHVLSKSLIEAGLIATNWGEEVGFGVAEGAFTLLLAQLKQLVAFNAHTKGGKDERIWQAYPCSLRGRNIGLYGFGPIGRRFARMLEAFEAKVSIYDPFAKDVPPGIRVCANLEELFSTNEIVSIHCGLNDATRLSVTRKLLALLPQGGVVINTARGWVVDEQALADEVAAGRLLAGVDVIQEEGEWEQSPLAPLSGAVMTRHKISGGKGYPPEMKHAEPLAGHVLENLAAYREGRPLKFVIRAEEYDLKT